jgi:hypothetical protein
VNIKVVPEHSALIGTEREVRIPMNDDHLSICRFRDRDDPRYVNFKGEFSRHVDQAPSTIAMRFAQGTCLPVLKLDHLAQGCISHQDRQPSPLQAQLNGLRRAVSHVDVVRFNHEIRDSEPICNEGTREQLLGIIKDWITSGDHQILWFNGAIGVGKSTVAQTIAQYCFDSGFLGASYFFCDSNLSECNNGSLVFKTIAHQLTSFDGLPMLRSCIARHAKHSVLNANIHTQFSQLIIKPLQQVQNPGVPLVVVMDGLDRCNKADKLLDTLLGSIHMACFLKFLIISRSDHDIRAKFDSKPSIVRQLDFHTAIPRAAMDEDIKRFFFDRLRPIFTSHSTVWLDEQILKLVKTTAGSIIHASIAVDFIDDKAYRDPLGRLNTFLRGGDVITRSRAFDKLNRVYLEILDKAVPRTANRRLRHRFLSIVGTIALLVHPLPVLAITRLLCENIMTAMLDLAYVQSVFLVPSFGNEPLKFHPSFSRFLTDANRSNQFFIDPCTQHGRLARHCFKLIRSFLLRNCTVTSIAADMAPPELVYAYHHWPVHLSQAYPLDRKVIGKVRLYYFPCSFKLNFSVSLVRCVKATVAANTNSTYLLSAPKCNSSSSSLSLSSLTSSDQVYVILTYPHRLIYKPFPSTASAGMTLFSSPSRDHIRPELITAVTYPLVASVDKLIHLFRRSYDAQIRAAFLTVFTDCYPLALTFPASAYPPPSGFMPNMGIIHHKWCHFWTPAYSLPFCPPYR